LVDHPDEVVVTSVSGPEGITFQVRLWPTDVGKVIGRSGRMAIALRIILNGIAKRLQSNLRLEIADS
jgi:predicted RNA-binding protein YlqC (UPF0109 family)